MAGALPLSMSPRTLLTHSPVARRAAPTIYRLETHCLGLGHYVTIAKDARGNVLAQQAHQWNGRALASEAITGPQRFNMALRPMFDPHAADATVHANAGGRAGVVPAGTWQRQQR
jgi:hypothetical protein